MLTDKDYIIKQLKYIFLFYDALANVDEWLYMPRS